MTTTQVLRKLFLGIAAAFSEAAGDIDEVTTATETPTKGVENGKPNGKSGKSTDAGKPGKSTGGKGKGKKPVEEETEEVESPYAEEENGEEGSEEEIEEGNEEDFGEEVEEEIEEGLISEENLKKLKGALNKYSASKGKPEAIKVLHKFAKTSTEVKEADFTKIMKALKV